MWSENTPRWPVQSYSGARLPQMSLAWRTRRSPSRHTAACEHPRRCDRGAPQVAGQDAACQGQGFIEKIPGGRKPGVRGRVRSPDPRAARLERTAERAIEMALKDLPVPLDKPPEQMTDAELFAGNFRESLLFNRAVLRQPIDLSDPDPEMLKTKREVALATQTAAVRIKVAELRPPGDDGVVDRLMQRVAALRRGEKVIEIDPATSLSDHASVARVG